MFPYPSPPIQAKWGQMQPTATEDVAMRPGAGQATASAPANLARHLAAAGMATMASGGAPPTLKLFLYAQSAGATEP